MPVYFKPTTFKHGTTAATGIQSVTVSGGATAGQTPVDGDIFVAFNTPAPVSFTVVGSDPVELKKVANIAVLDDVTFTTSKGDNTAGGTVTLADANTGEVQTTYDHSGNATHSVSGMAKSHTAPTV